MTTAGRGAWAILLAAGSGSRYGARKQYERIGGRRLVDLAVDVAVASCDGVVLVVPPGATWDGPVVDAVAEGGASRAASVRHGLAAVPGEAEIVVIHDAAHPLAGPALYEAVIAAVRDGAAAAAPVLPITETLVVVDGDDAVAPRSKQGLTQIQTPDAFRAGTLRELLRQEPEVTDEASLFLERGFPVRLVPGDPANIHVSVPAELAMADALLTAVNRAATS